MIKAFGDRILVRIVEKEKEKKGVLILQEEKKEFQIGHVVDMGPEVTLPEGCFVYTRKYAGLLVEYDGIEYVSLEPKEILAYSMEMK